MNSNIQILVDLAASLMDGQQPPTGQKLEKVENAVRELHRHKSDSEFAMLGLCLLGVLIDRVGSDIQAQKTLQKYIRGNQ